MTTSRVKLAANTTVEVNGRVYRAPRRPTVVIVVDGFDPAYLEHGFVNGTLPTLQSFQKNGFVGIARCSMPSTTNTNNTSIVTGVPPSVHGINGNYYLDSDTGKEIMITDASRLRCATILGALSRAGVRIAVVTAKDKLLKVLAHQMSGIGFSSEYAHKANLAENGIENVEAGRAASARSILGRSLLVCPGCWRRNSRICAAGPDVSVDIRLCAA